MHFPADENLLVVFISPVSFVVGWVGCDLHQVLPFVIIIFVLLISIFVMVPELKVYVVLERSVKNVFF